MSSNNRFLTSTVANNDIATETTLKDIHDVLVDGDAVVTASITSKLNVKTDTNDLVDVSINSANITGSLPISLSSVSITDFDLTSGQTSSVNVNEQNSDFPTAMNKLTSLSFRNGALRSNMDALDGTQHFGNALKINVGLINSNTVNTNSGSSSNGTQRVVLTNDYLSTSSCKITDIAMDTTQTDDLNVNVTNSIDINNFPLIQGISGSVTCNAGTNLNTSSLALESGGNLDDINSKQSSIVTATSNTASSSSSSATSLSNINTKIPSQGQALMANSLPVTIASDQTNFLYTKSYYCSYFNNSNGGSTNLATNNTGLGSDASGTVTSWSGNTDRYIHKLKLRMLVNGVLDPDTYGNATPALTNGFYISYKRSNSNPIITLFPEKLKKNSDIIIHFDETIDHNYGSGNEVLNAILEFKDYIYIDFNNGGYFQWYFGQDNYTSGNVQEIKSCVYYYA
jgi:hypothetical protein